MQCPDPSTHPSRRALLAALIGGVAFSAGHTAHGASDWPGDGIKVLLAYPPGGVSDQTMRALARHMAKQLKVPVVVENRPGASGTLALDAVRRAAPDGRTLAFSAATSVGLLWADKVRKKQGAATDSRPPVLPVAGVMRTPILIVGTKAVTGDSLADVLAHARQASGALRWATTGEGTTGHTVLRRVAQQAGVPIVHIPYKGGGQQIVDALGGQFEVLSTNVAPQQLQALRDGYLKALAVGAPQRLPVLPDVPTLAELGFARANLDSLFGLFAPRDTPEHIVQALHRSVVHALNEPEMRGRLLAADITPFTGTADDFQQAVLRELQR